MKRLMTLFAALLLMSVTAHSQEHFQFMGIPIDGTIENFEAQLLRKGFKPSSKDTFVNTPTSKFYDGMFAGNEVLISVYLTPKPKKVYSVSITFNKKTGLSYQVEEIESWSNRILKKYAIDEIIEYDENKSKHHYVDNRLGNITISYVDKKWLNICYIDVKNLLLDEEEQMEDL